jgi:GGDEF domain-containing protein
MGTPGLRKPVAQMTEAEKTRALLVDELAGLGSRRACDDCDRMPAQAMLEREGLKWINDDVGSPAGDELLRFVAATIGDEGVTGYRLGGDEFAFEGEDEAEARSLSPRPT